jgi:hypothetical protein
MTAGSGGVLGVHRDSDLEAAGARCGNLDADSQLITVIRKGTRAMRCRLADAFVWLRLSQAEFLGMVPTRDDPLWWTLR